VLGLGACSAGDHGQTGDAQNVVASAFPTFKADIAKGMPQLTLNNGGPVLQNARVVTVTFESDAPENVQKIEAFSDGLGATQYWKDTTSEYGAGPFRSDPSLHVHVPATDLPRFTKGRTRDENGEFSTVLGLLDTDLERHLFKHATEADSGWPQADSSTLYAVYVPKDVPLVSRISDNPGQLDRIGACDSFLGFHDEKVKRGRDGHFLYTIIYEGCDDGSIDEAIDTASHELAEAITDPFASTAETAALNGFDLDAWGVFNGRQEEIGDACEFYPEANVPPSPAFPFKLQSLWSNRSAKAGHDPCIPAVDGPYYNEIPIGMTDIDVILPPKVTKATHTRGYRIPPNQTRTTFSLGLYSDGPTNGQWEVTATVGGTADTIVKDGPPAPSKEQRLTVTFPNGGSSFRGSNGDKVDVTVTVDRGAQAEHGVVNTGSGIVVTFIAAKAGLPKHYMPVMIGIQ
jgi:hypothetical protein